jgi:methionine biosynthesis protein MetW
MSNIDKKDIRLDHSVIVDWVYQGSSVLEMGCGAGDLMYLLSQRKNANVSGLEIDEASIFTCVSRGLSVSHQDIDEGLSEYADRAFDYVVINQCLQEVRKPHTVLSEAVRVGKRAIVGFPNFAHYGTRIQLGIFGVAPVTPALPFQWYDTPNLHFLSIKDFVTYCGRNRLTIERQAFLGKKKLVHFWPNLLADSALFQISRKI